MRKVARARQSDWWARCFDELFFMYLSGARGINADYTYSSTYPGFANNPLEAPDAYHILYQGGKTKATLSATTTGIDGDALTLQTIDQVVARANVMGGGTTGIPAIEPIMIDGEEHHVMVVHPYQTYSLRANAATGQWLDIQKSLTTAEGRKNPIFQGGQAMYNGVVIHEHRKVIRFNDYGAGGNVEAARALFLGRQAAVCAFGSPGTGLRFDWNEEMEDRGNQLVITTSSIFGIKKTKFDTKTSAGRLDFGVIAVDTAIKDPTGAGM